MIRRILIVLVILGVGLWFAREELQRRWEAPLNISADGHHLTVAPGERFRGVVRELDQSGILADPYLILAYGRWTGLDEKIKRGEYLLPPGITALEMLQLLNKGEVIQYQVTLPEGITLAQAMEILNAHEELRKTLSGTDAPEVIALAAPYESPEGLFFPDSYRFEKGATDLEILQRARQRMRDVLAGHWDKRLNPLPYETPYEALIMASIVERETGVASEREEIAGVFVRRLLKRMRLQTDPTVIYGLGSGFDGNLRRKHLQDSSNPYNTYRHKGLPPTPISLPGSAAIYAALHPGEGETLYFVARGDGSHQFSKTLQEHQKAVRKFQLNRTSNYRSSPGSQ